jgi:hypothetical protein
LTTRKIIPELLDSRQAIYQLPPADDHYLRFPTCDRFFSVHPHHSPSFVTKLILPSPSPALSACKSVPPSGCPTAADSHRLSPKRIDLLGHLAKACLEPGLPFSGQPIIDMSTHVPAALRHAAPLIGRLAAVDLIAPPWWAAAHRQRSRQWPSMRPRHCFNVRVCLFDGVVLAGPQRRPAATSQTHAPAG